MDERVWTDKCLTAGESITLGRVTISVIEPSSVSYLITGNIEAAFANLAPKPPILGLLENKTDAEFFGLRTGRDSVLLLSTSPNQDLSEFKPGWNDAGFGVSDASDNYTVFSVSGEGADFILSQCGLEDLDANSPSASILIGDITVLLIREDKSFHLYVPSAYSVYMTSFFRGMAAPSEQ